VVVAESLIEIRRDYESLAEREQADFVKFFTKSRKTAFESDNVGSKAALKKVKALESSLQNHKPFDAGIELNRSRHLALDVVSEGGFFAEVLEVFVDFFGFPLEDQFDGAVGEVFDTAGEVIAFGELFTGIAKAHALDTAFVDGLASDHD
jgi:hypothetical protein